MSPQHFLKGQLSTDLLVLLQTKKLETTVEALASDDNSSLPPLMNPTMLEASDDLTNLSHLNEPAGMHTVSWGVMPGEILIEMQSCKPSSSAIRKRKYTRIAGLSSSPPIPSPG